MNDIINQIKTCNVTYHIPGKSDRSAMPLGNGELCVSLWVNEEGEICFYLSRSDALTELDRTVKLGMVKIGLHPNPFLEGSYVQTLDVADGYIHINGKGANIDIFVDTQINRVIITGKSEEDVMIEASYFTWRNEHWRPMGEFDGNITLAETPDIVQEEKAGILFYHKNGENIIRETAKVEEAEEALSMMPDLLTGRIFGGYLMLEGGEVKNGRLIKKGKGEFYIQVLTESMQGTEKQFRENLMRFRTESFASVREACRVFWNQYWENSYILVKKDCQAKTEMTEEVKREIEEPLEYTIENTSSVTVAYVLTRFMMKCCGNGQMPILYNGMLFNLCPGKNQHFRTDCFGKICTAVPGKLSMENNPDERPWCVEQLWQNIRHPYHTFLAQGETESLQVLFRYYRKFWDINRFRAAKYYQAEGQHNTEMTMTFGLQSIGIYGEDRTGKRPGYAQNRHGGSVDISPGLELLALMLDYYDFTSETDFFIKEIQVFAFDLYRYTETRFPVIENGKMVIEPLNAIETYRDTGNPITVIAGLKSTVLRLLESKDLESRYRAYFEKYEMKIPDLNIKEENGEDFLQPAERYEEERFNVEIPELYVCFPFGLYTQFSANSDLMKRTFLKRMKQYGNNQYFRIGEKPDYPSYSGWQYQGIVAAKLGMDEMAQDVLTHNVRLKNPGTRFPAMWGPIYDGVPDTDHGANIIHLLQQMVMQTEKENIYLFPAFPKKWDVSFRLHPDKKTTVTVEYEKGKLRKIDVNPKSEEKRIHILL